MPAIYYTFYDPESLSVRETTKLEYVLGRKLLTKGLIDIYGLSYNADGPWPVILTLENGKPYLAGHPDIFFNITHCRGFVACAFHNSPVGIDAELTGYFPEVLIGRALAESEKKLLESCSCEESLRDECFWRLWTLKEAYVKRTGIGVDTNLKAFSFDFEAFSIPDMGTPIEIECSDPEVSCFQIFLKSGHIVSICTGTAPDPSAFNIIENVDFGSKVYEDSQNTENQNR